MVVRSVEEAGAVLIGKIRDLDENRSVFSHVWYMCY